MHDLMPAIDDVLITLRADAIANRRASMPLEDLVAVTPLSAAEYIDLFTSDLVKFLGPKAGKIGLSARGLARLRELGPQAMMGHEE